MPYRLGATEQQFPSSASNKLEHAFKPTKSIKDLVVGKKYPICKIKKVTTKHGDTLVAELNDCQVYLPKRLIATT
ncbi:hypothetical protein NQ318_022533 [Aromia moschata]|uniref:Uncharacterized protein n=1 Tax=Aromia moschata TaxID=1265417 RepID=A0AAV8XLV7_9CUCU|nr:hypothetical protein NQ318_022533 [Aromia moschata]